MLLSFKNFLSESDLILKKRTPRRGTARPNNGNKLGIKFPNRNVVYDKIYDNEYYQRYKFRKKSKEETK